MLFPSDNREPTVSFLSERHFHVFSSIPRNNTCAFPPVSFFSVRRAGMTFVRLKMSTARGGRYLAILENVPKATLSLERRYTPLETGRPETVVAAPSAVRFLTGYTRNRAFSRGTAGVCAISFFGKE